MASEFDIIKYLQGIFAGYVFDKTVLERIALERGVEDVESYSDLDQKTRELLRADLACAAYYSPNVWASSTQSHGSYTKTVGSQTIYVSEKERLYNIFASIYKKYEDPKLEEVLEQGGTVQWVDEI